MYSNPETETVSIQSEELLKSPLKGTHAAPDMYLIPRRLTNEIGRSLGITRDDALIVVDHVFRVICNALLRGERVAVRGFGRFKLVTGNHKPRTIYNVYRRTFMEHPQFRMIVFKTSAELKKRIRKLKEMSPPSL